MNKKISIFLMIGCAFFFLAPSFALAKLGDFCTTNTNCSDTPGSVCINNECTGTSNAPAPPDYCCVIMADQTVAQSCTKVYGTGALCRDTISGKSGTVYSQSCGTITACINLQNKTNFCCVGKQGGTVTQCKPAYSASTDCGAMNGLGIIYEFKNQSCGTINECKIIAGTTPPPPPAPDPPPQIFEPPKLQIDIPTVQFSNKFTSEGSLVSLPWLAQYIAGVYKYGVGIVSLVAIVMIMVGGLRYLTAGGNASATGSAKQMISGAVIGLILALGSYTVLYTINPDLVSFRDLRIKLVGRDVIDFSEEDFSAQDTTVQNTEILCQTKTSYAGLEKIGANELAGVKMQASEPYLTPAAKEALKKAGQIAQTQGYSLVVKSACRSPEKQEALAAANPAGVENGTIARPGKSVHGMGIAVDIFLVTPEGKTVGRINSTSQCKVSEIFIKKLSEIMFSAGWVRYEREIWHFEYGSNKSLRGNYSGYPSICK